MRPKCWWMAVTRCVSCTGCLDAAQAYIAHGQWGVGNWKSILNDPQFKFDGRSPVDLKDRYVLSSTVMRWLSLEGTAPHVSAARADASGSSTTAIGGGFHLLPHNLGVLLGSITVVSSPSPTLLRIHRKDR